MTCRKERSRLSSWGAVGIASLALVATSAPEPADIEEEGTGVGAAGDKTLVIVRMNEEANADATGLEVSITVSVDAAMAGETAPAVVTVVRASDDALVAMHEVPVEGGEATLVAGNIGDCPEDGNCRQSFWVSVTHERAYDLHVMATVTNDESGCAFGNPSFSDEAELEVTVQ